MEKHFIPIFSVLAIVILASFTRLTNSPTKLDEATIGNPSGASWAIPFPYITYKCPVSEDILRRTKTMTHNRLNPEIVYNDCQGCLVTAAYTDCGELPFQGTKCTTVPGTFPVFTGGVGQFAVQTPGGTGQARIALVISTPTCPTGNQCAYYVVVNNNNGTAFTVGFVNGGWVYLGNNVASQGAVFTVGFGAPPF